MSGADTTCSAASAALGEPLAGTAPEASAWLCLEQPGPWGAKAWTDSQLDADLGRSLEAAASAHGIRPALIRRPGRPADRDPGQRQVLIAWTVPGGSWLLQGSIGDPAALLDLDWPAIAAGDRDATRASAPALAPSADPQLLVCTNGTRDQCCAKLGRPVALAAAAVAPDTVWEVTHTSGHRFAATTVLLPAGVLHGRVLDAVGLLTTAGRGQLALSGYRGRSCWPAPGQAAEEHVRRSHSILGLDDLRIAPDGPDWRVEHRDGRWWRVAVDQRALGSRPESCGKPAKPALAWEATTVARG